LQKVLKKIPPVHKSIVKLDLALNDGDQYPEKISQELVHKKHIDNVIISKPQRFGNIWYFNMFEKISEFNFDHESDHLQGMLLTEAARQTGIATIHLNGLPAEGKLNMSDMRTNFINYVEHGSPVIVRSVSSPVIFEQGRHYRYHIIVNLIQFGKICVTAYLEGLMFKTQNDLIEYKAHSVRINEKTKAKYQSLLNKAP
jgi:hypothetical protein